MRTIYLHIGSEKTGSTSIQRSLSENSKKIASQGLYFPRFNNQYLSFLPLPFGDPINFKDVLAFKSSDTVSRKLLKEIRHVFSSTDCDFVLSSEFFQSRLRDKLSLEKLKLFLHCYFDKIFIVCYLRDPWEKSISLLSESIKVGSKPLSISALFDEYYYHACSIERVPRMWKSVFPCSYFFSIDQLNSNQDVVSHFYTTIGVNCDGFVRTKNMNQALSINEAKLLSFFRYSLKPTIDILSRITSDSFIGGFERRMFHLLYKVQRWIYQKLALKSLPLSYGFDVNHKNQWINSFNEYESCRDFL